MALEIEGKIIRKLNVQSGTSQRGEWSKQEFIIEFQEGNFPSQVCMSVWGADKVKELESYKIGDNVKVSFNLSSREYNSRWYTDVRAWRIEKENPSINDADYSSNFDPTGAEGPGVSFKPTPTEAASTGHGFNQQAAESQAEDDLPF